MKLFSGIVSICCGCVGSFIIEEVLEASMIESASLSFSQDYYGTVLIFWKPGETTGGDPGFYSSLA